MRSKKRTRELLNLAEAGKLARPVTIDDRWELLRYFLITDFAGQQNHPKGFAICRGDLGYINKYGDVHITSVIYRSSDSEVRADDTIRFLANGMRVRILEGYAALDLAKHFKEQDND